ncbi:hypothetical protein ACFYY5_29660 [Nocardia elegans]|uniref:LtfC/p132/Gp6 beta-sandwich domain-containing protein n=1 Tax=Nocardia elegans TaxID=300029 RepID=A0ABW6TQR4_9NOCA
MSDPLFDPPLSALLPLSWHSDLVVDFQNVDPTDNTTPVDYETGVAGYLDLKMTEPQRFPATITGSHAVVRIESETADNVRGGTQWVFVLSYPGDPSTEIAVVNGVTARYDGKGAA